MLSFFADIRIFFIYIIALSTFGNNHLQDIFADIRIFSSKRKNKNVTNNEPCADLDEMGAGSLAHNRAYSHKDS